MCSISPGTNTITSKARSHNIHAKTYFNSNFLFLTIFTIKTNMKNNIIPKISLTLNDIFCLLSKTFDEYRQAYFNHIINRPPYRDGCGTSNSLTHKDVYKRQLQDWYTITVCLIYSNGYYTKNIALLYSKPKPHRSPA